MSPEERDYRARKLAFDHVHGLLRLSRPVSFLTKLFQKLRPSPLEAAAIILTGGLLVALTPVTVVALTRGGPDGGATTLVPTSTSAPIGDATVTSTPTLEPTATAEPSATVVTTPSPAVARNRQDCGEIRGSAYLSRAERGWFLSNCEPAVAPAASPAASPTPTTAPSPGRWPGLSPAQAGAQAAGWAANQPFLSEVSINAASCGATSTGNGQWFVNCQGTTAGCLGADCEISLWICFSESPSLAFWLC